MGLIDISPSGAVIFVSDLYPGSIFDKQLTRQRGILDLLKSGDLVMAVRGFDIEENLALLGIRLNISPFRKGKEQFTEHELVETKTYWAIPDNKDTFLLRNDNCVVLGGGGLPDLMKSWGVLRLF